MANLEILEFPDPRLRTVAKPVETFDEALRTLIDDMLETMRGARGIGLAGTVVDPGGNPLQDARVSASRSGGGSERDRTEEGGRFEFDSLNAGSWTLEASHEDWAASGW